MTTTEPSRCTFVDGTEARDLNVGRLGLCGPEAMQRAIERQDETGRQEHRAYWRGFRDGQENTDVTEFAEWLLTLDDPDNEVGMHERQTVTLTAIIERARVALGEATG